jgi:hypothetical protein
VALTPALVALTPACTEITGDPRRVIAIEIVGPTLRTVEEGGALQLEARAVNARGEVVPDAPLTWVADTDVVGFTVDAAGLVTTLAPDTGDVVARVESLSSGRITIRVTAAPDSVAPVSAQRLTVPADSAASPPLTVEILDTTTEPDTELALSGKPVHFHVVEPLPGTAAADGLFLALADTVPGTEPHALETVSGTSGQAWVVVRRAGGTPQPDSAIVYAVSLTATADTVAGSPVQFVVLFGSN